VRSATAWALSTLPPECVEDDWVEQLFSVDTILEVLDAGPVLQTLEPQAIESVAQLGP